ncbi:hypothetical protein AKJ09_01827 [Labilithrix luteola]|uniref:Uncharacterized protein n=1 Tax=Labilithrix luteola TaxID=1391654 RepID=A0A0K1PNQ9_9BACT|nr:hypothetical protein AKJ09_01827 [Labilithrix luteola]
MDVTATTTELDEESVLRRVRANALARGYRAAARRALVFARQYRAEEKAPGGDRERACIEQARAWRSAAHAVHITQARIAADRPGLARARRTEATTKKIAKSG